MGGVMRIVAALSFASLAAGCGSTVEYDPRTSSDATAPSVNLLVRRAGQPDLEVQTQTLGPHTQVIGDVGEFNTTSGFRWLKPDTIYDFSVLATATDPESGIESMRLLMNRTVCYMGSGGAVLQDYRPSETRRTVTYTDPANAPVQASLGYTGIVNTHDDSTGSRYDVSETNLIVHTDGSGARVHGVGVMTEWYMEAENFNGTIGRSNSIMLRSGNVNCYRP